jgi:ABC-type sugar transport system ATPase subunit
MKIADAITVIRDGQIVERLDNVSYVTERDLAKYMTGKDEVSYDPFLPVIDTTQKPVLELQQFTKKGHFSNIDMKLYRGEILESSVSSEPAEPS